MPYQKTTAGLNEIQSRQLGLRAELRRLLIMVDGRSPLAKFAPAFPGSDVEALGRELAALGLIADPQAAPADSAAAVVVAPAPPVAPPAVAASPAPTVDPAVPQAFAQPSLAQVLAARQAAVRFVNETLGPSGEALALRLERCKDADALRAVVRETRVALDRVLGAATGERFMDAVRTAASNVV